MNTKISYILSGIAGGLGVYSGGLLGVVAVIIAQIGIVILRLEETK